MVADTRSFLLSYINIKTLSHWGMYTKWSSVTFVWSETAVPVFEIENPICVWSNFANTQEESSSFSQCYLYIWVSESEFGCAPPVCLFKKLRFLAERLEKSFFLPFVLLVFLPSLHLPVCLHTTHSVFRDYWQCLRGYSPNVYACSPDDQPGVRTCPQETMGKIWFRP